jgi:hypothetical protein
MKAREKPMKARESQRKPRKARGDYQARVHLGKMVLDMVR